MGVNNTSNIAAEMQATEKGWTLIQNSDLAFSIENMYEWTVRESDNKLVHKSTGKTPVEAKKPDGTIVSNDQLNGKGKDKSYQEGKTAMDNQAVQEDASFMINNQITTCGFDISIIPSVQLDDTSVNYISGLENINKFLKSAETITAK
ncbi:hypothetical protein [Companilactobacillus bobalius]|uniref:hypothetical protein n=1 Tax=Companilactobacillus bobalius TaxID=2801451 RepID=UPI001F25DCB1|nr:hypothetical protein [Companilactobacillus bobalius]KAE9560130.1 hypothetical protein ATN92_07845 [Companilactobacillus bobalius]